MILSEKETQLYGNWFLCQLYTMAQGIVERLTMAGLAESERICPDNPVTRST